MNHTQIDVISQARNDASIPMPSLSLPSRLTIVRQALERLCSSKSQAQFTAHAAETWMAALAVYPTRMVVREIAAMSVSDDPFPSLGKLMLECERQRRRDAGTMPSGGVSKLSSKVVNEVVRNWELGK